MNPSRRARADPRIVREDDPEHARLTGLGWRVVSRSWGARLTLADDADVSALEAALAAVRRAGYAVRRLGGAGVNAGSLTVNRALGFELEPAWHALAPPPPA